MDHPFAPLAIGPEVGADLRAARLRAGLGVCEAASLAGISNSFLSGLEHGMRAPGGWTAACLAATLPLGAETVAALQALAAQVDTARRARKSAGLTPLAIGTDNGAELRAARLSAGLCQREAARRAHLSHSFLSKLEHGVRAPSAVTAVRLVATLPLSAETTAALYAMAAQVESARRARKSAGLARRAEARKRKAEQA